MVSGMIPSKLPDATRDMEKWFETALTQMLNTRAAQAIKTMEINKYNIMQVIELSLTKIYEKNAGASGVNASFEDFTKKVVEVIGEHNTPSFAWQMAEATMNSKGEGETRMLTGSVEPRVSEWMDYNNGKATQSLEYDESRVDRERLSTIDSNGAKKETEE